VGYFLVVFLLLSFSYNIIYVRLSLNFPIFLYKRHSTEYLNCPSQEFLDGIRDKELWQETPWHEPERKTAEEMSKAYPKMLAENEKLNLIIKNLEKENEIKDTQIADLRLKLKFAKKGL
jgi:hypothetical protein